MKDRHDTPLRDAIERIGDQPGQSVTVDVLVTPDDQGVSAQVDKDLGKGWWFGAQGGYWRKAGGYVAARLGWKK